MVHFCLDLTPLYKGGKRDPLQENSKGSLYSFLYSIFVLFFSRSLLKLANLRAPICSDVSHLLERGTAD